MAGVEVKYQMREKMFAIDDDFWVETDGGQPAFKADGEALRIRKTLILEAPEDDEAFTIQKKLLSCGIHGCHRPAATGWLWRLRRGVLCRAG